MKYFNTYDFIFATTLVCLGFTVADINKTGSERVMFIFTKTPELEKAIKLYWAKALMVEPQQFASNQKFLKSMIYQDKTK